ncbi:MAG: hypothetical protein M3327_10360, partial [Actinomycetota bacterium]|nr:hypothetical protein [Actinomycetota bacterium]
MAEPRRQKDAPEVVGEELAASEEAEAEAEAVADAERSAEAPTEPDARIAELERERDERLDDLRRLAADFDNYRKRAARDQALLITRRPLAVVVEVGREPLQIGEVLVSLRLGLTAALL